MGHQMNATWTMVMQSWRHSEGICKIICASSPGLLLIKRPSGLGNIHVMSSDQSLFKMAAWIRAAMLTKELVKIQLQHWESFMSNCLLFVYTCTGTGTVLKHPFYKKLVLSQRRHNPHSPCSIPSKPMAPIPMIYLYKKIKLGNI